MLNWISDNGDLVSTIIFGVASIVFGVVSIRFSSKSAEMQRVANELAIQSKKLSAISNSISEISAPLSAQFSDFSIYNIRYCGAPIQRKNMEKDRYYQINLELSGCLQVNHGEIDTIYIANVFSDDIELTNIIKDKNIYNNDGMSVTLNHLDINLKDLSSDKEITQIDFYIAIVDKTMKISIFAVILKVESYIQKGKPEKINENTLRYTTSFKMPESLNDTNVSKKIDEFILIEDKYLVATNYIEFCSIKGSKYKELDSIDNIEYLKKISAIRKFISTNFK